MSKNEISRRSFLAGAAVAAAGATTIGLAGCSSDSGGSTAAAAPMVGVPEKWDDEADIIIVGYGGSGSVAALSATDQGSSVIVLEKDTGRNGGNMGRSSGVLHDSPGADVEEWVKCYLHGTLQSGAPEEDIREFMTTAVKLPEILEDYGIAIEWVDQPTSGVTWPKFQLEGTPKSGASGLNLFNDINTVCESKGIDVRLSTPAKRLIQNPETKEILGVTAEDSRGNALNFKANKAVIMAIGGYERNPRMFYQYNYAGIHLIGGGNQCAHGDGFPMVTEVGAQLWHMNQFHTGGMGFVRPSREMSEACSPKKGTFGRSAKFPYIFVGPHGKRFMNEAYIAAHDANHKEAWDYSSCWAFRKDVPGSTSNQVLKYTDRVSEYIHLPMFLIFDQTFFDEFNPLMHLAKDNAEAIERGWIWKGDTIEELAAKMEGERPCAQPEYYVKGVPSDVLSETLATFNQYCADGFDPEFLRNKETLHPLTNGPFYAAEVQWTMDFTEGGPRRNGKCQTISVWDEPIPRLYSTGEFGSFNATAYTIGGLVQAISTGHIAGIEASKLDSWDA